jgi:hypothetical protein
LPSVKTWPGELTTILVKRPPLLLLVSFGSLA